MRKYLRWMATIAIASSEPACGVEFAQADTVTIGYFDPAHQVNGSGIQILGTASGQFPMVQLLGNPILPNGVTGFGFDQILAAVIPPGGNNISGGLGGPNPTFEFVFNDGFAPPQGGTSYLYASWRGTISGESLATFPTHWGVIETPQVGTPGYTVTTQVLVCSTPNPFCGPFVGGTFSFVGQDQFTSLQTRDITLSGVFPIGIEAPNLQFQITEVFAFTGLSHPPFAQGDVGAVIETTFHQVPAPIVGTGPAAGLVGAFMLWLARRRRKGCRTRAT